MSERIIVALQNESNRSNMQDVQQKSNLQQNYFIPDTRKEEMKLHLHMKNRKKYTHLYQLEKYFR